MKAIKNMPFLRGYLFGLFVVAMLTTEVFAASNDGTIIIIEPQIGCVGAREDNRCLEARKKSITATLNRAVVYHAHKTNSVIIVLGYAQFNEQSGGSYRQHLTEITRCIADNGSCPKNVYQFFKSGSKAALPKDDIFQFNWVDSESSFSELLPIYSVDASKLKQVGAAFNIYREANSEKVYLDRQLAVLLPTFVAKLPKQVNNFNLIVIADSTVNMAERKNAEKAKSVDGFKYTDVAQRFDNNKTAARTLLGNLKKQGAYELATVVQQSLVNLYMWQFRRYGEIKSVSTSDRAVVGNPIHQISSNKTKPGIITNQVDTEPQTIDWLAIGLVALVCLSLLLGYLLLVVYARLIVTAAAKPLTLELVGEENGRE